MDKLVLSLKKRILLPSIVIVSLAIWMSLCAAHYKSYWEGTIERVQTVDFNMLHHTMPTTVSHLILSGEGEALQKLLDSTYGIFGIVITDPEGKRILYKTEKVYKRVSWQENFSIEKLQSAGEGYDLLTDPPPVYAQHIHEGPRSPQSEPTGAPVKGRVIGRLYYVRGVPPTLAQDMLGALKGNWLELSGSKRGYVLLTFNVIGFSMSLVLLILWRRQWHASKRKELELAERELIIRRRALDTLNADLMAQRQRKEWLEREAELAYSRALRLRESLTRLKEAFFMVDMSPGGQARPPINVDANQHEAQRINVRPPMHPPSAVIQEVESLLPDLTNNAKILRSQAEVLQSYCSQLESRQVEMQRILEQRALANRQSHAAPAAPAGGQVSPNLSAEQTAS